MKFKLSDERKELFESELLGKVTNAGRIYRKIIAQDKEFIKLLKKELNNPSGDIHCSVNHVFTIIDKLSGFEEEARKCPCYNEKHIHCECSCHKEEAGK